jgi:putative phage-type endonuclease
MRVILDDFEQESERWFQERLGNPGSASFDQILTNVKGEPSKSAPKYMKKLAVESVTGQRSESYASRSMQRGSELQPEATMKFMEETGLIVREIAICYFNEQRKYHASTDGIIDDDNSVLEIKCPEPHTHVDYLFSGEFPKKDYNAQVQGEILCTHSDHAWFVSYYPGLKPFIIKVMPDWEYIEKLKAALDDFCLDLATMIRRLKNG